jgi:hypothetical protein
MMGNTMAVPESLAYKLVLPIVNRTTFLVEGYQPASNLIDEMVVKRLVEADNPKFERLLRAYQADSYHRDMWRRMFKGGFHRTLLSAGGIFKCRQLSQETNGSGSRRRARGMDGRSASSVIIDALPKEVRKFQSVGELQSLTVSEDRLWLPSVASFPAVDSIVVHNSSVYLFKCSQYADHGYNYDVITALWRNLEHVREHIKGMYLVLPTNEVYDAGQWQKQKGKAKIKAESEANDKVESGSNGKTAVKTKGKGSASGDKAETHNDAKVNAQKGKGEAQPDKAEGKDSIKADDVLLVEDVVEEVTWPQELVQWKLLFPLATIGSSGASKPRKARKPRKQKK